MAVSPVLSTSHEAGCSSPGSSKQGSMWEHPAYCLACRRCSGNASDSLLKNTRTLCLILSQIYSSQILLLHPSLEPCKVLLPFFSFQSWGCEEPLRAKGEASSYLGFCSRLFPTETYLAAQWLRLRASTAGGHGFDHWLGN